MSLPLLNQGVRWAWHNILKVLQAEGAELIVLKNQILLIDKLHGVDYMDIASE